MKLKLGIRLASGLGAALAVGTFAGPAFAEPVSCTSQYNALVQAQQTYDSWDNMVWTFENSAQWYYQDLPDGTSQLMVNVDYQDLDGDWVETNVTDSQYGVLDSYLQRQLTLAGNSLAAADDAYATNCGY